MWGGERKLGCSRSHGIFCSQNGGLPEASSNGGSGLFGVMRPDGMGTIREDTAGMAAVVPWMLEVVWNGVEPIGVCVTGGRSEWIGSPYAIGASFPAGCLRSQRCPNKGCRAEQVEPSPHPNTLCERLGYRLA